MKKYRYRIWSNHKYSEYCHNAYFAGYIDDLYDARKSLANYRAWDNSNSVYELHAFKNGLFVKKLE